MAPAARLDMAITQHTRMWGQLMYSAAGRSTSRFRAPATVAGATNHTHDKLWGPDMARRRTSGPLRGSGWWRRGGTPEVRIGRKPARG